MDIDFGRPSARVVVKVGAILLVIGALLDTVSNAISIIPIKATYIGSIVILLALPVLWALDKNKLLTFRHRSGRIIRPFDRPFSASLIALLVVLWLPRMFGVRPSASGIPPVSVRKEFFLKGHIQDEFTRKPIEGASVAVESSVVQTDSYGDFTVQFVTTEAEPLIRFRVAAEGYRAAVDTVRLQGKVFTWDRSLRSYISEDLRRLIGDWEASYREGDKGQKFLLKLTDLRPPELRGKFKTTVIKYPPSGQIPQWGQPFGPVECGSVEDEVVLSVTDNAIWMNAEASRNTGQEEEIGCGISVSTSTETRAVRVRTLSPSSIEIESPPGPSVPFYRVNAPGL